MLHAVPCDPPPFFSVRLAQTLPRGFFVFSDVHTHSLSPSLVTGCHQRISGGYGAGIARFPATAADSQVDLGSGQRVGYPVARIDRVVQGTPRR